MNIDDAKTRKNAMYSIIKVVTGPAKLGPDAYSMATEAFFEGLEDYSVDSHGDVGSWVRDASMKGLDILINNFLLRDQALTFLPESERSEFSVKVIAALCRQSVERIDKLRDTAGRALTGIIWNLNDLKIPGLVQLRKILNK